MKNLLQIIILVFTINYSFAQDDDFQDDYFREKINLEFMENYSKCYLSETKNGISEVNGKTEFWSICNLDSENRIIRIESYENDIFYQEVYFEINKKLRYAKETENYNPKNGFAEKKWNCEFYFDNGKLMTYISLGHGKTEEENWNPESIIGMYRQRISELNEMKK